MKEENRDLKRMESFSDQEEKCVYYFWEKGEKVYLRGEERKNGVCEFSQTLDLSKEERDRALLFFRYLSESRTFPRIMASLAEEFFS